MTMPEILDRYCAGPTPKEPRRETIYTEEPTRLTVKMLYIEWPSEGFETETLDVSEAELCALRRNPECMWRGLLARMVGWEVGDYITAKIRFFKILAP